MAQFRREMNMLFKAYTIIHTHIYLNYLKYFLPAKLCNILYIKCTILTITRASSTSSHTHLLKLAVLFMTLATSYIVELLATLPPTPILDYNIQTFTTRFALNAMCFFTSEFYMDQCY